MREQSRIAEALPGDEPPGVLDLGGVRRPLDEALWNAALRVVRLHVHGVVDRLEARGAVRAAFLRALSLDSDATVDDLLDMAEEQVRAQLDKEARNLCHQIDKEARRYGWTRD